MKAAISGYICTLAGTAMLTGAALWIAEKSGAGRMVKMTCSLAMILAIVSPLNGLSGKFAMAAGEGTSDIRRAAEEAAKRSVSLQESAVAGRLAEYIEERAMEDGIHVRVEIEAFADKKNMFSVDLARAVYSDGAEYEKRKRVAEIMEKECGIPEDIQEHVYEDKGS